MSPITNPRRLLPGLVAALISTNTFGATQWSATTHTLVAGDFNGDGEADLLVIAHDPAHPSGIALGNGSGQPSVLHQSWASNYLGIDWFDETYQAHIGDFDLDGQDDVFLQRKSGGNHYVLLTDSNAEIKSIHQTISNTDLGINWSQAERRIEVGDFDYDGRDDLYLQSDSLGVDNSVVLASSSGTFTTIKDNWDNDEEEFEWNLPKAFEFAGDFNGDSHDDYLIQAKPNWVLIPFDGLSIPIPTYRDDSYGIALSAGDGSLGSKHDAWDRDHLDLEWSPEFYKIFVDDFNGDGYDDVLLQAKRAGEPSYIVLTDSTNGKVSESDSGDVHELAAGYLSLNWDATSYNFVVGDFDDDGQADIYMQALTGAGTSLIAYTDSYGDISSAPTAHNPSTSFKKHVPGAIPGGFSVSSQGAGTYTIPINAPAATGGLKPNLALSYNHLTGSGLAGMRWTLTGFSSITRCQQTFAQGGVNDVSYNTGDYFCLDGQRLVAVDGTNGQAGTEYRTEIETFQRIEQIDNQASSPKRFRVDHGNGLSSFYGDTEDSRIEIVGSSSVRTWYISYTEDQFGNRIEYSYDENGTTGEAVPTEVAWTSNSGQSLSAKYKVSIAYESRPDQRSGFDSGSAPFARTKRIDNIEVTYNTSQTIGAYDLTYATGATGRSQLTSVSVCGEDECLPETTFNWQDGTASWGSLEGTGEEASEEALVGDFNNDGKADIFVSLDDTWQVYLGEADGGLVAERDSGVDSTDSPELARVIEYNGDGMADLLYVDGTSWNVLISEGDDFASQPTSTGLSTTTVPYADIRDRDGDGLGDWHYVYDEDLYWMRNTGQSSFETAVKLIDSGEDGDFFSYTDKIRPAPDINGDGASDMIYYANICIPNPPFPPACTEGTYLETSSGGVVELESLLGVRAADVNGDGLDDLLYVTSGSSVWLLRISEGNALAATVGIGVPKTNYEDVLIADYDNDGLDDILRPNGNTWEVYRSTGTSFAGTPITVATTEGTDAFVADITGDGFPEIVQINSDTWNVHKHQSELPDVITTFTSGLGYSVAVEYESLSNSSSYTTTATATPQAPYERPFNGARYIVASEQHDDGIGGTRELTHSYDSAWVDPSGRGWLSFHQHRVDDAEQGTYTRTYFSQTWPFAGMVELGESRRSSDNQLIRDVDPTLDKTTNTGVSPNLQFVRVETTTTREYDGAADGAHLRTIVENPTYDATFGYVTTTTQTITDPGTSDVWTSVTNYNPTQYTTPWCLGLPGLVQTTSTLPDSTSAVRKVRYTFSSSNCSLTEVKDESEASDEKQLKTTYTYDNFGNVDVVSQDSVGGSAQNRSNDFDYGLDGQFPIEVTIGTVNLTTELEWDYLTGQRKSVTGPDGLETSWTYDNFGRVERETRPIGHSDLAYIGCGNCFLSDAAYYVRVHNSDGSQTNQYVDMLGREVGRSWTLPFGDEARSEKIYNGLGRLASESVPYIVGDSAYYVDYVYDLVGRLTQQDAPVSESSSGKITEWEYLGNEVSITNPDDDTTKYTYNAARQIERVTNALGDYTEYEYHPFGELAKITDPESNVTEVGYDARGFKTALTDPNYGDDWTYDFDVYGQLYTQTSPIDQGGSATQTLTYDEAGRPYQRVESEGTTTWTYYSSGTGAKGKVNTISGPGHSIDYDYLSNGLVERERRTFDSANYDFNMTYTAQGQLDVLTYPETTSSYRYEVNYDYDAWGNMTLAKDDVGTALWTLREVDALGREVWSELGNGLDELRTYDRASGLLKTIETGTSKGATGIQDLEYDWHVDNNLWKRTDHNIGETETLVYDEVDRLTSAQVTGEAAVTLTYSDAGNIWSKSDVGTYHYNETDGGPFAVTCSEWNGSSCDGMSYVYDDNGRMTARGSDTQQWYSYDLPKVLKSGSTTATFSYGVDRQRYKQVVSGGSTIYYAGQLFEKEGSTYRHYVHNGARTIAMMERVGTTNTTQYLHRDHQGSVVEVTDSSGDSVQSLAFDPWGLRRDPTDWSALGSPFGGSQQTERGYTGHEHLDPVGLIHMNGRVQDPVLGRFISADPVVQAPYNEQSLNRYSYVWNNPASLMDPSGYQSTNSWEDPDLVCQFFRVCLPQLPEYTATTSGSDRPERQAGQPGLFEYAPSSSPWAGAQGVGSTGGNAGSGGRRSGGASASDGSILGSIVEFFVPSARADEFAWQDIWNDEEKRNSLLETALPLITNNLTPQRPGPLGVVLNVNADGELVVTSQRPNRDVIDGRDANQDANSRGFLPVATVITRADAILVIPLRNARTGTVRAYAPQLHWLANQTKAPVFAYAPYDRTFLIFEPGVEKPFQQALP